jgi:peroxin-6
MIQTGVEQSRVPDVASGRPLPSSFPKQPSRTVSPESPYGRMYKITLAALMKNAAEYRLHLSLLLNGPRGVGKCTVATWVSQTLGIHLLDVSLFS